MKWSLKIGQVSDIGIYIHATFLIIIGWVALVHWQQDHTVFSVMEGVVFILLLFGCVVLHELGHALSAQRFQIKTRDITLLPIGGVARLERMPDDPKQELWVALAGPAVNVVIAAALFIWLTIGHALTPLRELGPTYGSLVERLLVVNLFLAAFNLLPAFPMDGGRILRAILALRMEHVRATRIAAVIGQAMALVFGFIGLFTNPFLLFIALFVWIGAAQESSMTQMKSALGGIPVSRAMVTNFQALDADDTLERAVELILAGSQHDFPVVRDGRPVGILTRADLMRALAGGRRQAHVSEVMQREFQPIDSFDMLDAAFRQLQQCSCHTLPVMRAGRLVGLLTSDNVGEFIMIQSALKAAARKPALPAMS
jgi:Zn-dependent protease/CBS domain-containing protein